jgi:hypothetical protein
MTLGPTAALPFASFSKVWFSPIVIGTWRLHRREHGSLQGICGDVQQHSGLSGDEGPLSVEPTVYRRYRRSATVS